MWKRWAILFFFLLPLPAALLAQLTPVSNVVFQGGIAPGYTELQTNGMIRWNPTNLIHEGWNGSTWAPIAGSGSGFPLTNDTAAGGFSVLGFNTLTATNAVLAPNITSISNQAASALASSVWAAADSTTNYASRVDFISFTNAYAAADSTTNYASRVDFVDFTNTYFSADPATNYARRTGDTFTGPVTGTFFFVDSLQSTTLTVLGQTLLNDDTTIKGDLLITNDSRLRVYSTNATFNLTGDTITFSRTTNSSGTTLNMGTGGKILAPGNGNSLGSTTIQNLSIPGNLSVFGTQTVNQTINQTTTVNLGTNFVATTQYTTNVVFQTTVIATNFLEYVTNFITTYVNIGGSFTMGFNSIYNATNAKQVLFPGFYATNDYATTSSFVTATGTWDFSGADVSGLTVSGGNIASLTSAWSMVYSDGSTNSISLPLGAPNTVLRSTGTNSDPVWAVLDDLSWKLAPVSANYTSVSYNFVLADTAATDIFITLPVASVSSGKVVAARKMSNSNTLYVKSASGDLVQGVGTVGVVRAGSVIEVISNGGTDWWLK